MPITLILILVIIAYSLCTCIYDVTKMTLSPQFLQQMKIFSFLPYILHSEVKTAGLIKSRFNICFSLNNYTPYTKNWYLSKLRSMFPNRKTIGKHPYFGITFYTLIFNLILTVFHPLFKALYKTLKFLLQKMHNTA